MLESTLAQGKYSKQIHNPSKEIDFISSIKIICDKKILVDKHTSSLKINQTDS
jgi:hypothetical protein